MLWALSQPPSMGANPLVRARDGIEALDYLFARGQFAARDIHDLPMFILLDLNIPKLGGLEVLEEIRANVRTRHLPVIILSSSGEEKDRRSAYDRFANSDIAPACLGFQLGRG